MYSQEQIRKITHDLQRPLSNLEMLITILKGSEMDKVRLIENLERILQDGKRALDQVND